MPEDPTLDELRHRASALGIPGRSSMNKDELQAAVARAERDETPIPNTPDLDGDPALDPEAAEARDQADAPGAVTPTADDVIALLQGMPLEELFRVQRHANQEVGRR